MRKIRLSIAIVTIKMAALVFIVGLGGCGNRQAADIGAKEAAVKSYWTCGMHPSVRVTDEEYQKGKKNCPICGMNLIPASPDAPPARVEQEMGQPEIARHAYYGCGVKEEGHCPHCDENKTDASCVCGGHSFITGFAAANCPVCGKPLKELEAGEAGKMGETAVSRVRLKPDQVLLAGLLVEPAGQHAISRMIRTVGKIAFDPELAVAEEEFLTAVMTREKVSLSSDSDVIKRADDLVDRSKLRLRLLGLSDSEIEKLKKSQKADTGLILPGENAWVYAEIYEYDIAWVKEGEGIKATAVAFPGEEFKGVIRSLAPVLDPKTRSVRARIEVENPGKKLKPEMYVDIIIENIYTAPDGGRDVLAVPKEAILDTGTRKIIYVQSGEGEYTGKEVKTGPEGVAVVGGLETRLYPVLSGIKEGDLIVRRGNFLIDSQSQLAGGMSVLWGGAQEIEPGDIPEGEAAPVETKHRH